MAPPGCKLLVNQAVLAERNPANIAPVAVWVQCEQDWGCSESECRAGVSALQVEEQCLQIQREKEEKLSIFQREVKRRVNHQAKLRKKHQIQKSCNAAAREGCVVKQTSDAARLLTPKRNTCVYRRTPVAICSPHSRWVSATKISENLNEESEGEKHKLLKDHTKTLNQTMTQVRHRLAALQTVEREELTLPGGVWKVSPTRDNPVSRRSPVSRAQENESEDLLLTGYHDLPIEVLAQRSGDPHHGKQPLDRVCSRLKVPYPAGPAPTFSTDYRASLVLRPGVDEEDERKQRQNQYVLYRRLFMDIEREQVKEMKRQKQHHHKMLLIKREKELQRQLEEQRLRAEADLEELDSFRRECERLALERDIEKENLEKTQKTREYVRYIEALRAQMKEKMKLHSIELPPLCCCGSDFWGSHPDTCANNCIFYKNPKAYTRALQSVISSRDTWDGGISTRFSACNLGT